MVASLVARHAGGHAFEGLRSSEHEGGYGDESFKGWELALIYQAAFFCVVGLVASIAVVYTRYRATALGLRRMELANMANLVEADAADRRG